MVLSRQDHMGKEFSKSNLHIDFFQVSEMEKIGATKVVNEPIQAWIQEEDQDNDGCLLCLNLFSSLVYH